MDARSTSNPARAPWPIVGGALAVGTVLWAFWPGIAMYDSVAQYGEALSGSYGDWHPPVLARLWSLFGAHGAAPMLAVQVTLYWVGLGLVAAALVRIGRPWRARVVLAIGVWPPLLGWQAVVLKDTQMLGALLAATGIVAWWRLQVRQVPVAAGVLAAALIAYATLVRANAVFASVPLAIGLLGRPRGMAGKGAATVTAILLTIAAAPLVNHRLLGAEPTGVEKTQPLYDLAGIAAASGDTATTGLSPAAIATIRARHCVSAYFWDPLGSPDRCDAPMDELRDRPANVIYALWLGAIVRHPLTYAARRIAHLNSTERWLVPWRWPAAAPPSTSERNDLGLGSPGGLAAAWQGMAAVLVETPAGWPLCWIVMAATALAALRQRAPSPARQLGRSLLASALVLEASFAVLSIASDLRYHLWPMTAAALGIVLLADDRAWRTRVAAAGGGMLLLVMVAGLTARIVLPPPVGTYQAMLNGGGAAFP